MAKLDFEQINYRLRPAKCIERKMLCESFQKLVCFQPLKNYQYVGFGSISFIDFSLFHRSLGINRMVSIDRNIDEKERFEFNIPYKCITPLFGSSTTILPTLKWKGTKSIVWMDYTDPLDNDSISDIETITANIEPGSIVLFTCRSTSTDYGKPDENKLTKFKEFYDDDLIPIDLKAEDLEGWNLANTFRRMINDRILKTILERNGKLKESEKINYEQLYFFCYKDGAKMFTTGGIILQQNQDELFQKCEFNTLPYISKKDDQPFIIDVPILTLNEVRFLDSQLPFIDEEGNLVENDVLPNGKAIPEEDLRKYKTLYRYFPAFTEVEIH